MSDTDLVFKFVSADTQVNTDKFFPQSSVHTLPEWYKKVSKYTADELKTSTFKNCVPFFDAMSAGYCLVTPCDIEIVSTETELSVKVLNEKYVKLLNYRPEMHGFHVPEGYHSTHYAWLSSWGINTPEGYSALYTTPFNRYDLPFICTSGIIDNDKMNTPGMIPFFIRKNVALILPAGTPFIQILPFKREHWEAELVFSSPTDIRRNVKRTIKFRSIKNNYYRLHLWVKKVYKMKAKVTNEYS